MKPETIRSIIDINNRFYKEFAESFSNSREYFWDGWELISEYLNKDFFEKGLSVIDIGCGNGRFYKFLVQNNWNIQSYLGLDASKSLLNIGKLRTSNKLNKYVEFDCIANEIISSNTYDLVVSFGFLHHIPSYELRMKKIQEMYNLIKPGGYLVMTFWISKNVKPKLTNLSQDMIDYSELENGDLIIGWKNIPNAQRYIHIFSNDEVQKIIDFFEHKEVVAKYKSDGKSGEDNLYIIIKKTNNQIPQREGL